MVQQLRRKLVGFVLIWLVMSASISFILAHSAPAIKKQCFFDGVTRFVGGSGPGNYTSIQAAIDDSSDGDTVFVFNGTYYESLIVDKAIHLLGENKYSTVIVNEEVEIIVDISADGVVVQGFTIDHMQDPEIDEPKHDFMKELYRFRDFQLLDSKNYVCINVMANDTHIVDNILKNCSTEGIMISHDNNLIENNTISHVFFGLLISLGKGGNVSKNVIYDAEFGIMAFVTLADTIFYKNNIFDCQMGVVLFHTNCNVVKRNNIRDNGMVGLAILDASGNRIIENNFIGNSYNNIISVFIMRNFVFEFFLFIRVLIEMREYVNADYKLLRRNIFDGNYWGEPLNSPKFVGGLIFLLFPIINFDFRPAQEPYDI